jgi:hypothetical protein
LSEKNSYPFIDRLLHRIVLGYPVVSRMSFNIELMLEKERAYQAEQPIFISGLARAGTTILMRIFHETGGFRSLTYRDMPFVLMPNTWKNISKFFKYTSKSEQRAHNDGILIDFDSPEAFDEIFWKFFSTDNYIFEDYLAPHNENLHVIEDFRNFVRLVVSSADDSKQKRYLSKNNNNILRLNTIQRAFPEALIIIPFRNPVQHAISLFEQHTRFCDIHKRESFSRDYMNWLGHYEFGTNHKPFFFREKNFMENDYKPDNINYWLIQWINTYSYLKQSATNNSVFVCYERLCKYPEDTIKNIFQLSGISENIQSLKSTIRTPQIKTCHDIDEMLEKVASQLYSDILKEY